MGVSLSTLISVALGDEGTCDSAKTSPKVEKTVRSHLRDTIRSVWTDEILREQTDEVKAFVNNKFEEMKVHFQDQIKNAIEDANPKVIFSAIRNSDRKNSHVNEGTTITYDEANVNVGGGMDIGTGNFIVPVSGIYSFSFRALTIFDVTY